MWLHTQMINPVWHFDATGSIICDISGEKTPLLYSMVCHDTVTKTIIPVYEFVTTSHSEDSLAKFLSLLKKKFQREIPSTQKYFSLAPIVVMDFSWASINAVLDAFNMCNIDQYICWSFDVLFREGNVANAISVLIYLCSTHILKLIADKVKKLQFGEHPAKIGKKSSKEEKEKANILKKYNSIHNTTSDIHEY